MCQYKYIYVYINVHVKLIHKIESNFDYDMLFKHIVILSIVINGSVTSPLGISNSSIIRELVDKFLWNYKESKPGSSDVKANCVIIKPQSLA